MEIQRTALECPERVLEFLFAFIMVLALTCTFHVREANVVVAAPC
jgi:hypothetical protein